MYSLKQVNKLALRILMDGKLVKNYLCYKTYQISKSILILKALTLPWKRKSVKHVVCLFQQKGTYPLSFILRFPPFNDFYDIDLSTTVKL